VNKKIWILALVFNLIAAIEWTALGSFKLVCLYILGAMISIYFIMQQKKENNNEKEK